MKVNHEHFGNRSKVCQNIIFIRPIKLLLQANYLQQKIA